MRYIIMLLIVVMMAVSDIVTGVIKAYITDRPRSRKMRIGGLHKIAEITVMATAVGLEIGIEWLGAYYDASALAQIVGGFTAFSVFGFIVVMEIVSVLENYAAINPEAAWAAKIIKSLKIKKEGENHNDLHTS